MAGMNVGRRPVRIGEDVPAPGGEERARHEKGGGRVSFLTWKPKSWRRAEASAQGKIVMATVKGRRP